MQCISTVSYSVIINREAYGCITPSRGLCQGDHLPSGLFLLCAEGLFMLIHQAARNQALNGVSIYRGCLSITHLFFVDDSLLFCKATVEECANVLKILEAYERASSQKVNRDKTALFFSKSTLDDVKSSIKHILGVQEILQYEKYLGLPSLVGKGKKSSFNCIKERVWRNLQYWEGKLLSQAGREFLIKSVIQAIPT